MIFRHTFLEAGLWRGWLRNGQSLEICWPKRWSHGWPGIAFRVLIHANDRDQGSRMLNVALGPVQAFIPLGISPGPYQVGEEPSWGLSLSREFGLTLDWGERRKFFDWIFRRETLAWEYEAADETWHDVISSSERHEKAKCFIHPYRYVLKNGTVQNVEATIHRERWVIGRRYLHRIGWPKVRKNTIDVRFSGEVGERAGSWKGGCIGCSWDVLSGETPLIALRRMERERKF